MKHIDDIEEFIGQIIDFFEDYFDLHSIGLAGKNPQTETIFSGALYDAVATPIREAYKKGEDAIGCHIAVLQGLKDTTVMGGITLSTDDLVDLNGYIVSTIHNWME